MSENEKNVPKRRFKEFENAEAWEQRKLGDLSESFEYGLNAAAMEFDGENKYIRITDIDDESREFLNVDLTSPNVDLSRAENFKLQTGDIVFARTGASVGKSYIYKDSDELVYYAGFLIRSRIKPKYSAEFVFQNTLIAEYNKFIRITSQRSGQPGVNAQEYSEYALNVPQFEEQTKIGTFFRNLDNLITLHQRKLEKMKALKKAYQTQMFPAEGERKLKLRFAGFTDDWEQRKLGEIANSYSGGTPLVGVKEYYNGNIPFIRSGEINSDFTELFITEKGLNSSSARLVNEGDILYALYGATSGEVGIAKLTGAINQAILAIQPMPNYNEEYLMQWLRKGKQKIVDTFIQGGQGNLSGAIVKDLIIDLPQYEEQSQIGTFFNNLDNLITLHQRKLDKLQNIKKAYLNEMFI